MLRPGHAVYAAAYTGFQGAELAVVHIHTAPPDHTVYAQLIALINMIIHHGGQKIIGCADGMKIPGEMEIDILHGSDLGIAAAGGAALHAEHRPQGRLPQGQHRLLSQPV